MISLATTVVAGSLRFVMCRFVSADSSPAASPAISSGPNETSHRASAWITSDIGATLWSRSGWGCGYPAEMIVENCDKGLAKISQQSAFRDRPVAPSPKPGPVGRAPRTRPAAKQLLCPSQDGVEVLQRIAKALANQQVDQPPQQQRDRPQRRRGPAVAPRLGAADVGDGLRRQHEAVAGNGVDLFRQHGAARQQLRRAAEKTADLDRAFGGVL